MDKKKQIAFNLNNLLLSTSHTFDFVESQYSNTSSNHSKRIAFLSLKIGQELELNPKEMFDLCAYCLCHDIALNESKQKDEKFSNLSEEKIKDFPFLSKNFNILKYQNEKLDGSGIFGLKKDEIPLFSKIIYLSHTLDEKFDLSKRDIQNRKDISCFVKDNIDILFDKDISNIFLDISSKIEFWLDVQNESDILYFIFNNLHDFTTALDFDDILAITTTFLNILDKDSSLISNCEKMCNFYEFEHKDKYTFLIAASLSKIGKLLIPLNILEKKDKFTINEYEEVKSYPYYNKKILSNIMGFNDIAVLSSRIQELLDSSGYPYNLSARELSFKDRLLNTINVYTSLREKKNHKEAYSHEKSILLLKEMINNKKSDNSIVNDIDNMFLKI
jgi:HD-GYP domain-containing protein (c-di-GMP phosphodiesterase class II)